jgi:hypothetical protein
MWGRRGIEGAVKVRTKRDYSGDLGKEFQRNWKRSTGLSFCSCLSTKLIKVSSLCTFPYPLVQTQSELNMSQIVTWNLRMKTKASLLKNVEFYNLFSSLDITKLMKIKWIGWARHAVRIGNDRRSYEISDWKPDPILEHTRPRSWIQLNAVTETIYCNGACFIQITEQMICLLAFRVLHKASYWWYIKMYS